MTFNGFTNRHERNSLIGRDQRAEHLVHEVLAVARSQLQNLEILSGGHLGTMIAAESVIGHAKMARRKHIFAILIVREGPRLAYQGIDHMAIIDGVFAATQQPRHAAHFFACVPDREIVRFDDHVDLVSNQATVNGVHVAFDNQRTTAADRDLPQHQAIVQLTRRQFAEHGKFFVKSNLS